MRIYRVVKELRPLFSVGRKEEGGNAFALLLNYSFNTNFKPSSHNLFSFIVFISKSLFDAESMVAAVLNL